MISERYYPQVLEFLRKNGFRMNHQGTNYIAFIVAKMIEEEPNSVLMATEDGIYETAAKKFNTKRSCIERSVRYAINAYCMNCNDIELFNALFPNELSVTNKMFIVTIYNYLMYECRIKGEKKI